MTAPAFKTRAEQHQEWLEAQRCVRPLTNDEWEQLGRAEHAIYVRNIRLTRMLQEANEPALAEHDRSNAVTLERALREAAL